MFRLCVRIVAFLSFMLFVVTMIAILRSNRMTDCISYDNETVTYSLGHAGGYMQISRMEHKDYPEPSEGLTFDTRPFHELMNPVFESSDEEPYNAAYYFGTHVEWNHWGMLTGWIVHIPLWQLAIVTAITPLLWLTFRWVRNHRRRIHNRCVNCGYDLQGSDGDCPECGNTSNNSNKSKLKRA